MGMEFVKGDPTNPANPFHWSTLQLNLPGCPDYTPHRPRIQCLRPGGETLASITVSYVDDMWGQGGARTAVGRSCTQSLPI